MKHSARQYSTIRSSLVCVSIAALGFVAAACDSSSSSNTGGATAINSGFTGNYTLTTINGIVPASFTTASCTLGTCDTFTTLTLSFIGQVDPFVASLQVSVNGSSSTYPVATSGTFSFALGLNDATATAVSITPMGAGGVPSGAPTSLNVFAHGAVGLNAPTVATVKDVTGTTITPTLGTYTIAANDAGTITIAGTITSTDASSGVAPNFINAVTLNGSATPCTFGTFTGAVINWTCTLNINTGSTPAPAQSKTIALVTTDTFSNTSSTTTITVAITDALIGGNQLLNQDGINMAPSGSGFTVVAGGTHVLLSATAVSYSVSTAGGGYHYQWGPQGFPCLHQLRRRELFPLYGPAVVYINACPLRIFEGH